MSLKNGQLTLKIIARMKCPSARGTINLHAVRIQAGTWRIAPDIVDSAHVILIYLHNIKGIRQLVLPI